LQSEVEIILFTILISEFWSIKIFMKKQLSEIDSVYDDTICKLPKQIRLEYCEHLIDKMQLNITKNRKYIGNNLKEQLIEIITAAQNEVQKINKEK